MESRAELRANAASQWFLCCSLSNSINVLQNVSKGMIKHTQLSQNIGLSVVCKIKPFIWCKVKQRLLFTAIINDFARDTCRTGVLQKVRKMKDFSQEHACHTSTFQKQIGALQMYFMVFGGGFLGRKGWKNSIE